MLFDLGRATWSNVESLGREFLVFCLQPMLRAWESALTRALLTPEERASGFTIEFEEDDLTQASIADRALAYSSLIASRVINPNTARKWERLSTRTSRLARPSRAGGRRHEYARPYRG
jgi:phage portal protein BeeE